MTTEPVKIRKKSGPKPKGERWTQINIAMRLPLKRELEAVAESQGCSTSAWLRWAARMVLARRWKIPDSAKDDGDLR